MIFRRDMLAEAFNGVEPVFVYRIAARLCTFFTGKVAYFYTGKI